MNTSGSATNVGALTSVFFEVSAFNTNTCSAWQHEETIDVQRNVILTNLVRLWHVWIEVVLAVEYAGLNAAVQSNTNAHSEFDRLFV